MALTFLLTISRQKEKRKYPMKPHFFLFALWIGAFATCMAIAAEKPETDGKKNGQKEYEVFVLEVKNGEVAICSVEKRLLVSNGVNAPQMKMFLEGYFDAMTEMIASALAEMLPVNTDKTKDAKGGKKPADAKPEKHASLYNFTKQQEKGCRQVFEAGVLLMVFELNQDGTLGKMKGKLDTKEIHKRQSGEVTKEQEEAEEKAGKHNFTR
jgi:hypothetical protein